MIYEFKSFYIFCGYNMNKNNLFKFVLILGLYGKMEMKRLKENR